MTSTPHEPHQARIAAAAAAAKNRAARGWTFTPDAAGIAAAQDRLTKTYVPPECTEQSHAAALPAAIWLSDQEAATVSGGVGDVGVHDNYGDDLKPGSRTLLKEAGGRASIGKALCGHLYILTPESLKTDLAKRDPAAVEADLRKTV